MHCWLARALSGWHLLPEGVPYAFAHGRVSSDLPKTWKVAGEGSRFGPRWASSSCNRLPLALVFFLGFGERARFAVPFRFRDIGHKPGWPGPRASNDAGQDQLHIWRARPSFVEGGPVPPGGF